MYDDTYSGCGDVTVAQSEMGTLRLSKVHVPGSYRETCNVCGKACSAEELFVCDYCVDGVPSDPKLVGE
jgi:hypothetical protein